MRRALSWGNVHPSLPNLALKILIHSLPLEIGIVRIPIRIDPPGETAPFILVILVVGVEEAVVSELPSRLRIATRRHFVFGICELL